MMKEIASRIRMGAITFLNYEFRIIAIIALVVALLMGLVVGWWVGPLIGAVMSSLAALLVWVGYVCQCARIKYS